MPGGSKKDPQHQELKKYFSLELNRGSYSTQLKGVVSRNNYKNFTSSDEKITYGCGTQLKNTILQNRTNRMEP